MTRKWLRRGLFAGSLVAIFVATLSTVWFAGNWVEINLLDDLTEGQIRFFWVAILLLMCVFQLIGVGSRLRRIEQKLDQIRWRH